MKRRILATTIATALPLAALGSCGAFSSDDTGVSRVTDLMSWVERVHVESELAKQKVAGATDLMGTLIAGNFKGAPAAAFAEYVRAVQESEAQAEKLRINVRAMQTAAQPVFDKWRADVLNIDNLQLRQRSEARLDQTWQRYQQLQASTKHSETGFDSFNRGMKDLALFLSHDLNAAAVNEVREDARGIANLAVDLDGRFNRSLDAARSYLAWSGISEPTVAPPPGGIGPDPRSLPPSGLVRGAVPQPPPAPGVEMRMPVDDGMDMRR